MNNKKFKEYFEQTWELDGQSAKCIYGIYCNSLNNNNGELLLLGNSYPHDPSDLTRCFQCLRYITKSTLCIDWIKIIKMVTEKYPESKEWEFIYNNFVQLYRLYFLEYNNNTMPILYDFMKKMHLKNEN